MDSYDVQDAILLNTITRDDHSRQEKHDEIFLIAKQAGIMQENVLGEDQRAEGKGHDINQLHSTEHEELVPK